MIELSGAHDAEAVAIARDIGAEACTREGRVFAGVRTYTRGAAFLRKAVDG